MFKVWKRAFKENSIDVSLGTLAIAFTFLAIISYFFLLNFN